MPKVSVVTTVYNGEKYFDRAVPGILGQTYEDFEFVLVDDGSTDRTLERLRELAGQDRRIKVLAPGRLGAAAAYNYGIAHSEGEYVARQDFDDTSYPERLRRQVALLDSEPSVGLIGASYVLVDERRGERYVRVPPPDNAGITAAMARYVPIAHTMAMFRRLVWQEVGGYPLVDNLIDLRFYIRVAKAGWHFANVPEVLGEHYVHDASFFHRSLKYTQRQRDLARVQAQAIRELGLPRWMYIYSLGRHAYAYIPSGLKRLVRRQMAGSREKDV